MTQDAFKDSLLELGDHTFSSRLIVGTGKYTNDDIARAAIAASGAEMVTVAVRRVSLEGENSIFNVVDPKKYAILPNTAGCFTAEDAVRTARLAREALETDLVKLEVIGSPSNLFPDVVETISAAKILVKDGFTVLPYTTDDPVAAQRLEDAGCAAIMPLAAPIGSALGLRNPFNIRLIQDAVQVPVIVDAGVGTASHAARVMELGVDAILMNTGIAAAQDPVRMAEAMKLAVQAGRHACLSGRLEPRLYAAASSPMEGLVGAFLD